MRILRNDFIIKSLDGESLVLASKKNESIIFPIHQAEAVYLSLFNGIREDDEIAQISDELFEENSYKLKAVDRFLLPIEYAYSIFGAYEHIYQPMQFLSQKYKIVNTDSIFLHSPKYLTLCLTHKCLRRCIYCYAEAEYSNDIENDAISIQMIYKIINEAFDMAIGGVLLTGGEPMMYPHAYNIIDYLSNHGIYTQIITKHLLNEESLRNINTNSLDLCLSVDSNDSKLANWLTGSNTYFDDILENIKILERIGIPYKASIVITRKNEATILDVVRFLLDKGAKCVFTNHYACEDSTKAVKQLMLNNEEKRIFDEKWIACIHEYGLDDLVFHKAHPADTVKDLEHTKCSGLTNKVTINYNGAYILCDRLADINLGFSNVYEQSMLDHWNSNVLQSLRYPEKGLYKATICNDCNKFDTCIAKNSCYARSLVQHNRLFYPIKEVENVCNKR